MLKEKLDSRKCFATAWGKLITEEEAYRQLKEQRQKLKDQGLSPAQCDAAITPALRDLLGYPR